jgi:hypothetical protein
MGAMANERRQTRVGWLIPALGVVGALLLFFGLAGSAYGKGHKTKGRHTLLVTYVSAGAPVRGARLSVYGRSGKRLALHMPRRDRTTDARGYVVLVVPGRPRQVRVVARGGVVKHHRVDGWLQAIVRHPTLKHDVYVNPVTTMIAAYAARHHGHSLAFARRRVRHLLKLKAGESTGEALLNVTPYFNGLKFMRKAWAHGGVEAWVKHLIDRGKSTTFKGSELPPSVSQLLKYAGWAKTAISGAITAGNIAYDLFGIGLQSKESMIYEAVKRMEQKLNDIQISLTNIQTDMATGFSELQKEISETSYNSAILPVKQLAGKIDSADTDLQDYANNVLDPPPTEKEFNDIRDRKRTAIEGYVNDIKANFNVANDTLRDAFFTSPANKVPAYSQLAQVELNTNGHFLTHKGSLELQYLASYVLQFQAAAFNLIVHTESTSTGPNNVVLNVMQRYLGFTTEQARQWIAANANTDEPTVPESGDFAEEVGLIGQIRPVPEDAAVEADTLSNLQGPMWQVKAPEIQLGRTIHDRPPEKGMGCANQYAPAYQQLGVSMCQYMAVGWTTAQGDLTAAENRLQTSTSLGNWKPATLSETQTLFKRPELKQAVTLSDDYWDQYDNTFRAHDYQVVAPGHPYAGTYAGTGVYSGWYSHWVSGINVTTVKGTETSKGARGTCWFGVGKDAGSDCPALYALLRRPTTGERYWP